MNDQTGPTRTPAQNQPGSGAVTTSVPVAVVDIRDFFGPAKVAPRKFLHASRRQAVRVPPEPEIAELAKRIAADAKLQDRLLGLACLLPLESEPGALNRVVIGIMERLLAGVAAGLPTLHPQSVPDAATTAAGMLRRAVKSKRQQHVLLALYALVAVQKGWIDREGADDFIAVFFRSQPKPAAKGKVRRKKATEQQPVPKAPAMLPLLSKAAVLAAAVRVYDACRARMDEIEREAASLREEAARVGQDLATTQQSLESAEHRIQEQTERMAALDKQVAELGKDLKAQITTSTHDRQMLKARVKGFLRGELTRWLQTSHDAATAIPPRTNVITERLEQALALLDKEAQWMESSD